VASANRLVVNQSIELFSWRREEGGIGSAGDVSGRARAELTRFGAAHPIAAESAVITPRAPMAPLKTCGDGGDGGTGAGTVSRQP